MFDLKNVVRRFTELCREKGFSGAIKHSIKKATGRAKLEADIKALKYIVNNGIDITKFPPAKGALRELQLCDAALLNVFSEICKKYNFTFWLVAGTLIGAVRHKGFIPWDDDIDTCMSREEYNKFKNMFPEIVKELKLGEDFSLFSMEHIGFTKFCYKYAKSQLCVDIFPVDTLRTDNEDELRRKLAKYREYYRANFDKKTSAELLEVKNSMLKYTGVGGYDIACPVPEFPNQIDAAHPVFYLYDWKDILPLRTLPFENYELPVPNNYDKVLREQYGDYMKFPSVGIFAHNQEGVYKNELDMQQILSKLEEIATRIKNS